MNIKMKKILFYTLLVVNVVFLIISMVTWNLILGACAFFMGIGLTKLLDDAEIVNQISNND